MDKEKRKFRVSQLLPLYLFRRQPTKTITVASDNHNAAANGNGGVKATATSAASSTVSMGRALDTWTVGGGSFLSCRICVEGVGISHSEIDTEVLLLLLLHMGQ